MGMAVWCHRGTFPAFCGTFVSDVRLRLHRPCKGWGDDGHFLWTPARAQYCAVGRPEPFAVR